MRERVELGVHRPSVSYQTKVIKTLSFLDFIAGSFSSKLSLIFHVAGLSGCSNLWRKCGG